MALPISPAPKSDDVAIHGWSGITVRIAWTLLSGGIKVRPEVLTAARDHALYQIPASSSLPTAEDRAGYLTQTFISQAQGKKHTDPWPGDAEMPLSERWLRAIQNLRDRRTEKVFRMHYGDNRSFEHIEKKLGIDRIAVSAARGGLREVLRRTAQIDHVPLDTWSNERLDRVLSRLAAWSPDSCPPAYDVVNGAHRAHVRSCTRCNRMVRLVNAGVLEPSDLQAPSLHARPTQQTSVLVLQFHPDSRNHREALADELSAQSKAIGEDLLLVDLTDPAPVHRVVQIATEVAAPTRHHLRGAVVSGAGQWSHFGPIGALGRRGEREVRSRAWGTVDGIGLLPEELPLPPSPLRAWAAVAALAVGTALLWSTATQTTAPPPEAYANFSAGSGGTWAHFDVPDTHSVTLVSLAGGRPEAILDSKSAADKAELAVGDGSYLAHVPSGQALLVSTPEPVELKPLLATARRAPSPLTALSVEIKRIYPDAHVFLHTP